jgi:hypothetical protein
LFQVAKRKAGFGIRASLGGVLVAELSAAAFRVPTDQLSLFGGD